METNQMTEEQLSAQKEKLLNDLSELIEVSYNQGLKAGHGGAMARRNKTDKKKTIATLKRIIKNLYGSVSEDDQKWLDAFDTLLG